MFHSWATIAVFYNDFFPDCNGTLLGNGFCNDAMNNFECNYDNGDCCHATELIGNGQCDDETNTIHCNYDGGDCCLTLGASYVFVDGSCYYVEETLFNILGAKINCENILGRLFEPRDAFTNHRVMANIKENIPSNGGLIGN